MRTHPFFFASGTPAIASLSLLLGAVGSLSAASVKVVDGEAGLYARKGAAVTVGTAPKGVVLEALSAPQGDWIQVSPPPSMDCWIYCASVENGVTVVSHGKVRSSPNSTAPDIASIPRHTALDIRGKQGDWYRIAPPPGAKLWMRTEAVASTTEAPTARPVSSPPPVVVPTTQPPPVVVPTTQPPPVAVPTTQPPPVVVPTTQPPPVVVPTTPPPPVVVPTTQPPKRVATTLPKTSADVEFADPSTLVPKWVPPKEESVTVATSPSTTGSPKTPRTAAPAAPPPVVVPTTLPPPVTPPPVVVPTTPPSPVAAPVMQAPASPPVPATTTWTVPVPQPTQPPAKAPSARPVPTTRPARAAAPSARTPSSHRSHLPQHEVPEEWRKAASGTLLSSKAHRLDLRATPPSTLSTDRLAPRYVQGERGSAVGTLVKTGWSLSTKPGDYEIVVVDAEGHTQRVAYVHGSAAMLEPYVESRVRVEGTCWWLRSARAATLVPDSASSIQRLP